MRFALNVKKNLDLLILGGKNKNTMKTQKDETAKKVNADAIGMSALLTSTLSGQKDVIDALIQDGIREKYIIMVGGGATTPEWAEIVGADLYAENAQYAVRRLAEMIEKKG